MPRRTAEEAARTRGAIVSAARDLFTERGFAETAATDIADHAGVTRGALYHHFRDKRDLFRTVFEELEEELDAHARGAALDAARGSEDLLDSFLAGCRAFLEFAARPEYHRIGLVDGVAVLGEAEWHDLDTRLGLGTVETALNVLMEAGRIRRQASKPLALLIFGALNEAGFALARGDTDLGPEDVLEALRGLLARGTSGTDDAGAPPPVDPSAPHS